MLILNYIKKLLYLYLKLIILNDYIIYPFLNFEIIQTYLRLFHLFIHII
jgi:hypothetical protein